MTDTSPNVTPTPTNTSPGTASAGSVAAASPPVGVGVIGARSFVATRAVLPALLAASGTRLAAVSSASGPVPPALAEVAVGSYDEVITHPDVEAVYVPLPNGEHRRWVQRCAEEGRHVLCEKPLAPTAAEAQAMVDVCARAGVLLAEAYMTPFDRRWRQAMNLARQGGLGRVRHVEAAFTFTIGAAAATNYRWDKAQGGGSLLDVGPYVLGPAVELWGPGATVRDAGVLCTDAGVDATTWASLDWGEGRTADIRTSFCEPERQRLVVEGDGGALTLDGAAFTGGPAATRIDLVGPDGAATQVTTDPGRPYLGMVEAFARAVRGESWPRPAARAVEVLALLHRIAAAAEPAGAGFAASTGADQASAPGAGGPT